MTERLQQFLSHLKPGSSAVAGLSQKHSDDVVVTLAVRTPLTKAHKGGMKDTPLEHMLLQLCQVLNRKNCSLTLGCPGRVKDQA